MLQRINMSQTSLPIKPKTILLVCIFVILLFAGFSVGSCENVGIQNITYNTDTNGKFFDISLKNYENNLTTGRLVINLGCAQFNDTIIKNFEILPKKTKEFIYYYDFCRCKVSANINVKNNANKRTALTKNFSAITINFDKLNLFVSGKIFPDLNKTFKILNASGKEIGHGNIVNGRFSFKLPYIGKFVFVVEDKCNISKRFRTKYNTLINVKNELIKGKEGEILITNQKGDPVSGVSVFCDGKFCGRTNNNGIFKFLANKSFILSVPETDSTWPAKKKIFVKEPPKIEIITKDIKNKEQQNFSVGDFVIITFKSNNHPLNVSVKITNLKTNKTIVNATVNETKIPLNEEGVYEISAKKENFEQAKKIITVKRNFDMNLKADRENERITIKVLDDITKKPVSSAVVTISYEITENTTKEITKREKTDADGEVIFKFPPERYAVCIEKENYNKFCKNFAPIRTLEIRLSKNYIFEHHYVVFSNITITTFYAYKDIPVIADKIFINTKHKNFSIKPRYAASRIFLNETGKYEIRAVRKGYKDAVVTIFVEKTDVDVYLSVSKNFLTINSSKKINEIEIKCNNENNESVIKLRNWTNGKVKIGNISEKKCELSVPEQYRANFYVNNINVPTNSTNIFKFTITKVYDYTWLWTAIIIIVLLSTLVIVQDRYKKK